MLEIAMKSQFYLSVQNACAKVTVLQILQTASLALIVNFVSISIMKFFIMIDFSFRKVLQFFLITSHFNISNFKTLKWISAKSILKRMGSPAPVMATVQMMILLLVLPVCANQDISEQNVPIVNIQKKSIRFLLNLLFCLLSNN